MYAKRMWKYGNRMQFKKYHTFRLHPKGEKRGSRKKPTLQEIEQANRRAAEKRMVMKMVENFGDDDVEITLTYKKELRPEEWETMKRHFKNFVARMKRHYKKLGLDFKYMGVIEVNPFHFHVVINGCPDLFKVLRDLWIWGGAHITPLYLDKDFKGLVKYWFKQTDKGNEREVDNYPGKQRYFCSRNLRKPVETVEIVRANSWKDEIVVPKSLEKLGYSLEEDSIERGFDVFGYPYLEYTFIKHERRKFA